MLRKCFTTLVLFLALVIFTAACSPRIQPVIIEQAPPPLAPTATPLPEKVVEIIPASPTPEDAQADLAAEWQSITPPDETVTFELPVAWRHYGQDTNWSPDDGKTMVGLRIGWNRPGQAIEAGLLPEDANILEAQNEMMNSVSVRRFRIKTHPPVPNLPQGQEPPLVYETHLIFVRPDTMVFDFLLRASTEAEMDDLYPVLVHAVESAVFP